MTIRGKTVPECAEDFLALVDFMDRIDRPGSMDELFEEFIEKNGFGREERKAIHDHCIAKGILEV